MIGDGIGSPRRIFMIDGLGPEHLDSGLTPFLSTLFAECGEAVDDLWRR